jgi:hypothetical protein
MSKPIEGAEAQEMLAEAYALIRQMKFHMAQGTPTPRAAEDVRLALRDFCERYEGRMFPKKEGGEA